MGDHPALAKSEVLEFKYIMPVDSPDVDLPFPLNDENDPLSTGTGRIDFNDPDNVTTTVEYDPITGQYIIVKKIGDYFFRYPMAMSIEDYMEMDMQQSIDEYWDEKREDYKSKILKE